MKIPFAPKINNISTVLRKPQFSWIVGCPATRGCCPPADDEEEEVLLRTTMPEQHEVTMLYAPSFHHWTEVIMKKVSFPPTQGQRLV